jgi:hypothetical protein
LHYVDFAYFHRVHSASDSTNYYDSSVEVHLLYGQDGRVFSEQIEEVRELDPRKPTISDRSSAQPSAKLPHFRAAEVGIEEHSTDLLSSSIASLLQY